MEKIYIKSSEDIGKYVKASAYEFYQSIILKKGIDLRSMFDLNLDQLQEIQVKLVDLISDRELILGYSTEFLNKHEFKTEDTGRVLYGAYPMSLYLEELLSAVKERLLYLEQYQKVSKIRELVEKLPENEVKEKLSVEIKEFEDKKEELDHKKESDYEIFSKQIELGKHRVEMFEKRTNVLLKFIDRESVASIIGSLLLLTIGVCLLVMMFRHEEPLKIIESAFLLILGYFFGHSKNNK